MESENSAGIWMNSDGMRKSIMTVRWKKAQRMIHDAFLAVIFKTWRGRHIHTMQNKS